MYPIDRKTFKNLDRVIIDPECEKRRNELVIEQKKVDEYNQLLVVKWRTLASLERVEYYVKPDYVPDLKEIIERAKSVGLTDDKVIDLLIDRNDIFLPNFSGDYNVVPLKKVEDDLANGVHTYSLEVSDKLFI